MVKYIVLALTAIGLGVTVWLIGQNGFAEVGHAVAGVGILGFLTFLAWTAACLAVLGAAWLAVMPGVSRHQWGTLAWARTTREGASDVLPFSQFGGLIVGARTAMAGGIRPTLVYASLVADQSAELASQLTFALFGVAMLATVLAGSQHGADVLALSVAGTAILGAIVLLVAFGQQPLIRLAQGLAVRVLPQSVVSTATLPAELDAIYRRRGRVVLAYLLHLFGWVFGGLGSWVVLVFMGHHLPIASVLTIEALIFTLRTVAFAIPGAVGVQEAAYVLLGPIFGLPPSAGLALSLVKRARDLTIGIPAMLVWQAQEMRGIRRRAA